MFPNRAALLVSLWIGPMQPLELGQLRRMSAYWMLKRDEPYHDLGTDWHSRRNDEAHTRRQIAKLERLGHTVITDPAA